MKKFGARTWLEPLRLAFAFPLWHKSEDLEIALEALEIAEGSLEEVAEHYE